MNENYNPNGYYDNRLSPYSSGQPNNYYAAEPIPGGSGNSGNSGKKRSGGLIALCVILSLVCGFLGSLAANAITKSSGSNGVVIQSAEKNDELVGDLTSSLSGVVDATKDSVVEITTETISTGGMFGQYVTEGAGSGVIISSDGYIITNNHVVSGARTVSVMTTDGKTHNATVVGSDSKSDIAVIKIEATGLTAATIGDSSVLKVGDRVVAIGNPLGSLGGTVTEGIISALDREILVNNQSMTLLQTSAAVNPGNSGGGLFNAYGELIGIVNAKSSGDSIEGLGFAVPINNAISVATSLIESGYVTGRPVMGVKVYAVATQTEAQQYGVSRLGVYIVEVTSGGAADKAGIETGDYVVSVDGTAISTVADLTSIIDSSAVGDVLTIQVIRDTKTLEFRVTLAENVPSAS